jgi:hypothetical protein
MAKIEWPPCYGCGKPCLYVYCVDCQKAGKSKCPHGRRPHECNDCMVESDRAHDEKRA